MILQEEFKKNGYKDILVGDNASKCDIDLGDIFDQDQKPEELLSIFISNQKDELYSCIYNYQWQIRNNS